MNKKPIIATIICLMILGTLGFVLVADFDSTKPIDDEKQKEDKELPPVGNITSFEDAINQFCFDFFKKLSEDKANSPNIFYSPYSVFTALAMTYEGARENTAVEMGNVLHIKQDNESFHEYVYNLYTHLNFNDEYNLSTANALWPDVGFNLLDSFVDIIKTYYGGNVSEVEYANPEKAAGIINSWVENQTNNLIKDLVPADAIDPDFTRMILTNAIYFKGTWKIQFEEQNTTKRNFTLLSGENIQVDMMKLIDKDVKFNYTETDDLQILEMLYSGDDISMIILLPKAGVELSDIISSANREKYKYWIEQMNEVEADVYLPKFKFETSYGLVDYLIELGMIDAFNSLEADFSGITGARDLFISNVLHKAFVEVNEEGTEAAAATAVIMELTSVNGPTTPTRITFDCNRPFLFTINHRETGTILFMGSVDDPSQ